MQTRDRPVKGLRRTLVIPHWVRGLAVGAAAAVVLQLVEQDLAGFPRAVVVLLLYLLVLAAAADVVWHVWTCRKPAAVAVFSGGRETVACYAMPLRAWASAGAAALALTATVLHGGAAMSVLRAWAQLHRLVPPQLVLRLRPSTVAEGQPLYLAVTVDNAAATRYRCEWQGPVADWSPGTACDVELRTPLHFVDPDWPTRRIAVSAKVFAGNRLLGKTGSETVTISYAPVVELIADKRSIMRGQKARFTARVDGRAPGPADRCRWTVDGEFASSDSCTFFYTGTELAGSAGRAVKIGVQVENGSTRTAGTADAVLVVDQPPRYMVYLLDASRRMAQQVPTGILLDEVKNDLIDGIGGADPGNEFLGVATFGEDGSHPACFQNVKVSYPLQRLNVAEVKSILYLLQPVAPDAPLASAMLRGLGLFRPYAERAPARASFALVSVAGGLDTCAGSRPEATFKALTAVMDGARDMSGRLRGRLLILTIGFGLSQQDTQQWTVLAKFAPTLSPYVILPVGDIVALDSALRTAGQLGSRDYDARLAACADLVRAFRTRNLDAGAAEVDRYCRVLSAP